MLEKIVGWERAERGLIGNVEVGEKWACDLALLINN
jgi:hypothetical protein